MTSKQPIEYVLDLRDPEEVLEEIRPHIPKGLKVRHSKVHEKDKLRGEQRSRACALCRQTCVLDFDYDLQKDLGWDVMAFAGNCSSCKAVNAILEVSVFMFPQLLDGRLFRFEEFNNFVTGYGFTEKAMCALGDFQWNYRRENFFKGQDLFWIDRHTTDPILVKRKSFNAVVMEAVRSFKKIHPSIVFLSEYYHFEFDI